VILGILLAIAIPALTGYIAKAQDEQYKMDARDAAVAIRSVLDEAYSKGTLSANSTLSTYIQDGILTYQTKAFSVTSIGSLAGIGSALFIDAAALMGKSFPASTDPGYWNLALVGANSSTTTAMNADGFRYTLYPDGMGSDKPSICVTYRITRVDGAINNNSVTAAIRDADRYNAEAGYEVYHFTGF
jgi:type II secretory pathway pseudopilin PulG